MAHTMSTTMLALAPIAEASPTLSLIQQLQHAHPATIEVQPQQRSVHPGSRQLQSGSALTRENTRPLRVRLDFKSLNRSLAPQYSACFEVGEWFRRGLPLQRSPPSDGVQTCVRGNGESLASDKGCWGRCLASDVITPADVQALIDVVSVIAYEATTALFSVRPVRDLAFTVSSGAYERALQSRGYPPLVACAMGEIRNTSTPVRIMGACATSQCSI